MTEPEGVPLLPRLELDVGPGVAIDLPRDILGAARVSEAGLGQPRHRKELPLDAAPCPRPLRSVRLDRRQRGLEETAIPTRIDIHDRS